MNANSGLSGQGTKNEADLLSSMTDEEIEAYLAKKRRVSNRRVIALLVIVAIWGVYGYVTGLFEPEQGARLEHSVFYLGLALLATFGYFSRRH